MEIPEYSEFDRNRQLFFNCFPGRKTIQIMAEKNKKPKYPFNIPKVIHLPGGVYPDVEICKQELHDRSNWIPWNYIRRLEQFNDAGCCVSLTINETNGKGRTGEDIIKVRAMFADFDEVPLPETWVLMPSMIAETSPGKFHTYWFVEDFPLEMFSQTQSAIAYNLKTDKSMKDITKALRIPGFYHQKGKRFLSRIISHTGLKYSVGDFSVFPPEPVRPWTAPQWHKDIKLDPDKEFTGTYGTAKGNRNCFIAQRIGGMLKRGLNWSQIEVEAMKEAQACTPVLSEGETMAIIKSMRRY